MSDEAAKPSERSGPLLRVSLLALTLVSLSLLAHYASVRMFKASSISGLVLRIDLSEARPAWMPEPWWGALLREARLRPEEFCFESDLPTIAARLRGLDWIKSVQMLRRDFRGCVTVGLVPHRPVCVVKDCVVEGGEKEQSFANEDGRRMHLLISGDSRVLDEKSGRPVLLPVVDIHQLRGEPPEKAQSWLADAVSFIRRWQAETVVGQRFELCRLTPQPQGGGGVRYCRLSCEAIDRVAGGKVQIEWGANQPFSVAEQKDAEQKWRELRSAATARDRSFSSLNLSYREAGATSR